MIDGVVYTEKEGDDIRIDFSSGTSIWLRGAAVIEGRVSRVIKLKLDVIAKKMGLKNAVTT